MQAPYNNNRTTDANGTAGRINMGDVTTVASSHNKNASSVSKTPAPFCMECAFNFGHIIDGMDDSAAGALMVSLFVILVAGMCFAVGCWAHYTRVRIQKKIANGSYEKLKNTTARSSAEVNSGDEGTEEDEEAAESPPPPARHSHAKFHVKTKQ